MHLVIKVVSCWITGSWFTGFEAKHALNHMVWRRKFCVPSPTPKSHIAALWAQALPSKHDLITCCLYSLPAWGACQAPQLRTVAGTVSSSPLHYDTKKKDLTLFQVLDSEAADQHRLRRPKIYVTVTRMLRLPDSRETPTCEQVVAAVMNWLGRCPRRSPQPTLKHQPKSCF